jgi:hypothetical protein
MNEYEIKRVFEWISISVSKMFFILLILFVFAAPIFVSEAFAVYNENTAAPAIGGAEAVMVSAYKAVLDAEHAGANVSGLLARLNVAGEYLANAHALYRSGDFGNATRFANLCYDVGEKVRSEAVDLKNQAYSLGVTDLVVRMAVSLIGVIVIVFLSFLVWGVFKRSYQKRVLGVKPEVVSGES